MTQRSFVMVHTQDQWLRAAHDNTSLAVDKGVVQLAWELEARLDLPRQPAPPPVAPVGAPVGALVFDPWCRLYRSVPETGQVMVSLWSGTGPGDEQATAFHQAAADAAGDFSPAAPSSAPLSRPGPLAVDQRGRLFVAETARSRVLVYDLVERRLVRRIQFARPPVDLAAHGDRVFALFAGPAGLARFDAHQAPQLENLPDSVTAPSRLAVSPAGDLYVLDGSGAQAVVVPLERPDEWLAVPHASDIELQSGDVLVAARGPGQDFRRFRLDSGAQWELPHLSARRYDGRGIVRTPTGRIGFWSANGFAQATLARLRYKSRGRVTTFRLDSGQYQTVWGRLFIDACIPKGTRVRAHCLVMDEPTEDTELLPRTPPANAQTMTVHRPDLSAPMPPKALVADLQPDQRLHRRDSGREPAQSYTWMCADDTRRGFETYEAPVLGIAGRFLWVVLELSGTGRQTPRVKSIRAEHPSHDLMRRLPKVYSRHEPSADFLRRYLAIMEGSLQELDQRAMLRHVLLDPKAAPEPVLDWLAGFIGLVLDERWPTTAKRRLIAQGNWLMRYRGTVAGLQRFIEIYLNREVVIIEHFKVRGLGGAIVGGPDATASSAVLGAGFRVGGRVDTEEDVSVSPESIRDAFETHAHRFSVIIPMSLTREQKEVVDHILELHRPCHTLYDICSVDAGMKVGVSLYAQLTTLVGRGSGFGRTQVGGSLLGRHDILGRPGPGTRIGGSRLGADSRTG